MGLNRLDQDTTIQLDGFTFINIFHLMSKPSWKTEIFFIFIYLFFYDSTRESSQGLRLRSRRSTMTALCVYIVEKLINNLQPINWT